MTVTEPLLTPKQAAEILNVSYPTINRMMKSGALPSFKVGGRNRLRNTDVLAMIRPSRRSVEVRHTSSATYVITDLMQETRRDCYIDVFVPFSLSSEEVAREFDSHDYCLVLVVHEDKLRNSFTVVADDIDKDGWTVDDWIARLDAAAQKVSAR